MNICIYIYIYTVHILVGGLEHVLFSHILGIIIPIDFHIFSRGVDTTSKKILTVQPRFISWMSNQSHGAHGFPFNMSTKACQRYEAPKPGPEPPGQQSTAPGGQRCGYPRAQITVSHATWRQTGHGIWWCFGEVPWCPRSGERLVKKGRDRRATDAFMVDLNLTSGDGSKFKTWGTTDIVNS